MKPSLLRCACAACMALLPCLHAPAARAAAASAYLSGTVTRSGAAVAGARVTVRGNGITVATATNVKGAFAFAPLPLGTYEVTASAGGSQGEVRVDLAGAGAAVAIALGPLKEIGTLTVRRVQSVLVHGSGTDVVLNSTALTQMPFNDSFSEMEVQMPGAVRGANGVVHINGDHGVIDYTLDGVQLPQELNRDIGGEINLNDLAFVDLVEGAYPAQYGMRFGSVFNMSTKSGTGAPGFDGFASAGSYTTTQSQVAYHAPLADGGGYVVSLNAERTTRGLDPPNFSSAHNSASSVGQFARVTLPARDGDFTNITFINGNDSFQIPNDVDNGQPAASDDNETQADTFVSIQYHHVIGNSGSLTFGPAFKSSRIQDFGDALNDYAYGEALNVAPPPYGNGGRSTDCATALTNPAVVFLPTTCAYSLNDTRTALDYVVQADYTRQSARHTLGAGVTYDRSRVLKYYDISLQPGNFLAPIVTPETPNAATPVVDGDPNVGNTYESYIQDSWRMSKIWQADYGMRYDFFTIESTEFSQGFGSFSPRLKFTRFWGDRASLYAYAGRFFEPFSLENVSPSAAYLLNLPLQPAPSQFDLKPERDTQLEFGGHVPLGAGDLGFRVWQKNANDLIDDTQVGVTLLHQDINYALGRLSQEAVNFSEPLAGKDRAYFSAAHAVSHNSGCETQLLAPCFGSPLGYTPADHEQSWTMAAGLLLNNGNGGWFSADGEYGSGLSSAICPPGTPGYCKMTPHTTFNVEDGIAVGPRTAVTVDIQNVLNDRYFVTLLNAQGNHFAAPRTLSVGIRLKP